MKAPIGRDVQDGHQYRAAATGPDHLAANRVITHHQVVTLIDLWIGHVPRAQLLRGPVLEHDLTPTVEFAAEVYIPGPPAKLLHPVQVVSDTSIFLTALVLLLPQNLACVAGFAGTAKVSSMMFSNSPSTVSSWLKVKAVSPPKATMY